MPKKFEGNLDAKGLRFAVVVSRFNDFITERLVSGAVEGGKRHFPALLAELRILDRPQRREGRHVVGPGALHRDRRPKGVPLGAGRASDRGSRGLIASDLAGDESAGEKEKCRGGLRQDSTQARPAARPGARPCAPLAADACRDRWPEVPRQLGFSRQGSEAVQDLAFFGCELAHDCKASINRRRARWICALTVPSATSRSRAISS